MGGIALVSGMLAGATKELKSQIDHPDDVCGGIRRSRKSRLNRSGSSPEQQPDIVGGFRHETDLALIRGKYSEVG